jgi:hypothetical protein
MVGRFCQPTLRKGWFSVKKFIAMLLMGAVLFTGAVGCGGDTKPAKDKDTKPKDSKDKDKP